jgi:hypothetical protein
VLRARMAVTMEHTRSAGLDTVSKFGKVRSSMNDDSVRADMEDQEDQEDQEDKSGDCSRKNYELCIVRYAYASFMRCRC